MPYTLLKTNGSQLTIVQDGTIDNTTDLIFVGKNYTGYGNPVNENFVKLLENFAAPIAPSKPLAGELWFDTTNRKLKLWDGLKYKAIGIVSTGTVLPSGMNLGDLHFNGTQLYAYSGSDWTAIGPITTSGGSGNTGMLLTTVYDNNTSPHVVIEATIGTSTECVISTDPIFIVKQAESIYSGFNSIYPGLTLFNTNANGLSAYYSGTNIIGSVLWGTAATSLNLYDSVNQYLVSPTDIMRKSELSTGTSIPIVTLNNSGVTIGQSKVIQLYVTDSNVANINVNNGSRLQFNIGGSNVLNIDATTNPVVVPTGNSLVSLGAPASYFKTLYVTTVTSTELDAASVVATTVNSALNMSTYLNANTASITVMTSTNATIANLTVTNLLASQITSTVINGNQIYDTNARVLTTATIAGYLTGVSSIQGTANQIVASSTSGAVTLSLANVVSVNSLTGTIVSGGIVYSGGLPCLTSATLPASGVSTIQGTVNQILVNGSTAAVTGTTVLTLPSSVVVTTLSATTVLIGSSPAISQANISNYAVTSFSGSSTGFTPSVSTSGAVVLAGALNAAHGGTGATTLTGFVYGNGTGTMTAATTISASVIVGNITGLAAGVNGVLSMAQGGTGATNLNGYIIGNGTTLSAISSIPGSAISGNIPGLSTGVVGGVSWSSLSGSPPNVSVFNNDAGYLTAVSWASPGTIGSTTPNTGRFTSVTVNQSFTSTNPLSVFTPNNGTVGAIQIVANTTTNLSYIQFVDPTRVTQIGYVQVSSSGTFTWSGPMSASDFIATSDERLKSNISTLDGALDMIINMRGAKFNKIGSDKTHIGLIAQEVQKVAPELVHQGEDGYLGVAYGNVVALLIEAIKDQQKQIDDLKSKLGQ